jgi:dipicolinate synthase subunit B
MKLEGLNIGLAITGSFCTFDKMVSQVEMLVSQKANVYPIFSTNAATMDTRFGKAEDWVLKFEEITGNKAIKTICDAEPIGPKELIDILVIAPCTENASYIQNNFYFTFIYFDAF